MAEPRPAHPYYMYDAIIGQPDSIKAVIERESESINAFAQILQSKKSIHIVGIGTSWHASLVGEALFRSIAGRHDARAWNSFEFSSFPPDLSSDSAVIILSHRGTKQFSLKSLEIANTAGATTAILSGINSAAHVDLCNFVFRTSEPEKSSAFTISHTTCMTVLLLIAISLGKLSNKEIAQNLHDLVVANNSHLPDLVKRAIHLGDTIVKEIAHKIKDKSIIYFVGYGPNVSSSYEAALKIKEACYVHTEGFQVEQYLHGPFCATDERSAVVFIDPHNSESNVASARTTELIKAALEMDASVISLSAGTKNITHENYQEIVFDGVEENLSPVAYLVVLQLLTYHLSLELGKNPDLFRRNDPRVVAGLGKVKL